MRSNLRSAAAGTFGVAAIAIWPVSLPAQTANPEGSPINPPITDCNANKFNSPPAGFVTSVQPCAPNFAAPFDLNGLQHNFDFYSWETFVALNWPDEGTTQIGKGPRPGGDLSEYTKRGLAEAKQVASAIFGKLGATEFTELKPDNPAQFDWPAGSGHFIQYYGSGHIVGTYRMGTAKSESVVNADQRSWDHDNLYLVGSGTFPTVATANPTLTLAALSLRTADKIKISLN